MEKSIKFIEALNGLSDDTMKIKGVNKDLNSLEVSFDRAKQETIQELASLCGMKLIIVE